jgi:hypothetical protein
MQRYSNVGRGSSPVDLTAVFLGTLYLVLGLGFLALSPPVGGVLLTVGVATLVVFVAVERITRRGARRAPAPARTGPPRG